eukprot:6211974-Pleurochrysis_carterae.AAC.3
MDRECLYLYSAVLLWFMHVIVYWKPEDIAVRRRWRIACGNTNTGKAGSFIASKCANTVSGGAVSTQVMKDPPFPFHTASIDHKTVTAPKGTKY